MQSQGQREESVLKLGHLVADNDHRRDAGHVAFMPITAAERLVPGQRVGLLNLEYASSAGPYVGIVDPFLIETMEAVEAEQRFLLCFFPGSVTGLRHIYDHPALAKMASDRKKGVL